ncbi:TetR family transcriptional regulator [Rhodococcus sp. WMMA185]|uniref:TetR/AcrR family transcriptional regulator n=1 Tax=Rhodococcus sp. WMMA185 TaxID=679318 RepID=UPI0008787DEB|nr:TetR/AcrR family transcriptional regulator [Rhodococcus sp. WMMA185]AOW91690.1 TetR family transcriptional regulator [Rhodococcus sp. WMMA185]
MTAAEHAPGRPRDRRTHDAIIRTTEELITEHGYAGTSIGAIATRAGVGKDAIYRRWSGKPELVYEALFTTTDVGPVPNTGTLAGDITQFTQDLVDEFSAPAAAAALPGLLADFAADSVLRGRLRSTFLAPARERMVEIFERAVASGELTDDVDVELILDTLAGAVFFHVGLMGEPVHAELANQLADVVTSGVGAR